MKNKLKTFQDFFADMDWDMLKEQRLHLINVQQEKTKSIYRKHVLRRILKLIKFWFDWPDNPNRGTIKAYSHINWEQLKADKQEYLKIQELKSLSQAQWDAMEGVLNGLDAFQDAAVNELGLDEHLVFNLTEE